MSIEQVIAFNLALLAAIASPGPALLVAIQTSVSGGRRAGVAVGCGLGLMAAAWTLAALLGLEAVFRLFPWAYGIVKALGAAYLIYIAYQMWAGAKRPLPEDPAPARRAFRRGFLINLFNPKSVLFAAAVIAVVFPGERSLLESAAIALNHLAVEILFYAALAFALSREAVARRYLSAKPVIDRVAAAVLGALGLRLLLSR